MKTRTAVLVSMLLATSTIAPMAMASDSTSTGKAITPVSECLDLTHPSQIYAPDNKTVIVKTGPKYFRIDLKAECPRLGLGTPQLVPGNSNAGMRVMCGDVGDKVVNIDGLPCAVESMSRIDKDAFEKLEAKALAN